VQTETRWIYSKGLTPLLGEASGVRLSCWI